MAYRSLLLPEQPSPADLAAIIPEYTEMLTSVMQVIAERYERNADYPYIDTKLDLITGADFDPADPVRGSGSVYGWIQGRGVEALVGHLIWLRELAADQPLIPRLERILREVSANLWRIYHQQGGHLSFLLTPAGEPFILQEGQRRPAPEREPSHYGFADLFAAKGLLRAAYYLDDPAAVAEATAYCYRIDAAIEAGRFTPHEQHGNLTPPGPGEPRPQGPRMIHLSTAAALTSLSADPAAIEMGLRQIRFILAHHVHLEGRPSGKQPPAGLLHGDLWEMIGPELAPWQAEGLLLSNPGHSIEFVGLGLAFMAAAKSSPACTPEQRAEIDRYERLMPPILAQNFANGFVPEAGGICVQFDLLARRRVGELMPWWCLPETIRAAALAWRIAKDQQEAAEALGILAACHNAFTRHYVRPDLRLMAYQSRSTSGQPVAVIPATADADPGYHTGLSLLDVLRALAASRVA